MNSSGRDDPLESISKGVTKGALDWSKDQIAEFVLRLKNKNISFLEDPGVIEIAVEERKAPEADLCRRYIKDRELRTLANLGLTLRRVEKEHFENLDKYRGKINAKYGTHGLHVAEFFQHGLFARYIGIMVSLQNSMTDLENVVKEILDNIEKYVVFIKNSDNNDAKSKEIITRVQTLLPSSFIIAGLGVAKSKSKAIKDAVAPSLPDYDVETNEDGQRMAFFFRKKP